MKINIKDVAKKAGVSTATVSRALSDFPGVRDKTRKRVLKAVSELNYEINAVARNLRQKKTNSIGIIVGNVLSQFYSVIAKSVEDTANKFGYHTILCNGDENPEKELNYLKVLKSNRVDGIILIPTGKNSEYVQRLINSRTKVVLLDRLIEGVDCDAVLVDNTNGAYKAVKHLIDQGYSKIGNFKKESGKKLTRELLEQPNRPEAIFTTNIDMSMGALIAIKEMGFTIPDDIGIVCFDDSDWASILEPPITVIRQPVYQLGSTAAELLIKEIEDEEKNLDHKPTVVTLSTELIIRESTKKKIQNKLK